MNKKIGRYSIYRGPFLHVLDLIIINTTAGFLFFGKPNIIIYHIFITLIWMITVSIVSFYRIYRYIKVVEIVKRIIKLSLIFLMASFSFLGFYNEFAGSFQIIVFVVLSISIISFIKLFIYYFLRHFRTAFGGNYRKVVVLGSGKIIDQLVSFFNNKIDYGYKLEKIFDLKTNKKEQIDECFSLIKENEIDEIYCSLSDLNNGEINRINEFADDHLKKLKFIPDNKEILSRNLKFDYYDDDIPIFSMRNIPLDETTNKIVKRIFDILFSLLVIIFILSWLVPIMAIIIRIESKGSIFFNQPRNGLNYKEFICFKFRSMRVGANLDPAKIGDNRITKVGAFMRKTSIDELPQFFNVLLGNMSIVGPRPHAPSYNLMYNKQTKIDKFMLRHLIKPGITGLAQTKGYRGEVRNNQDIIFRVKYDLFYIENWTLLLDIKIIILTVYNAIKGEERAY